MILEQRACELVKRHWADLHTTDSVPDSLVFLKVAGKPSPNAAIIALILDGSYRRPVAVVKIPRNPQSAPGLKREYEAMVDLRESVRDSRILAHTPCRGKLVVLDDVAILLQAAGVGHPMVREMSSRESIEEIYAQILPWMFDLHAHDAKECILKGEALHNLVETPISKFLGQFGNIASCELSSEARQHLLALPRMVEGRRVRLCRQHGDFNAHNTLVEYDGGRLKDFIIIDWEDYSVGQLPIHDLNHFFTSNSHLLGTGVSPVESYVKNIMCDGWYHNLYVKAVVGYETSGLVDRETFWALTPLYFIEMCFRIADVQRMQQDTFPTWVKRMNAFCDGRLRRV